MRNVFIICTLFCLPLKAVEVAVPKSQCTDVDIRDGKSQKLRDHFTRPRDQDSIGWCYGFAAADLITAEVGEPVSSYHTSSLFNEKIDSSLFWRLNYSIYGLFSEGSFGEVYEGGWVDKAINAAVKSGEICKEEDWPFDAQMYKEVYSGIQAFESIRKRLSEEDPDVAKACGEIESILSARPYFNLEVEEVLFQLENNNLNKSLAKMAAQSCGEGQLSMPKFEVKESSRPRLNSSVRRGEPRAVKRYIKNIQKHFGKVNDQLEAGKPLAIDYNVKHVTRQDGLHASVLTARRWRNGKCEYKIRNSWGRGCASYTSSEITGCDYGEGSFWVTDQKLYEMADNFTYIER